MEPLPAPPALEKINFSEIDSYSCSNCSSNIKIISLDEKNLKISFECLNKDLNNNHHIQTMSINEYIKKMIINTYLFSKCSICNKIQNLSKDLSIFKYCIICNEVICEQCKEKHINISNNNNHIKDHYFINNNEKRIKCLTHFQNNNIIEYCFDCKKNLCKECLKTRMHKTHTKYPMDELLLLDENKANHKKIIELLIKDRDNLLFQKQDFINKLNVKINETKKKMIENYENKNNEIKIKLENDIKIKNDKLKDDLKALKQKYLKDVQFLKNQFEIDKNLIIENYNKETEINKKYYNDELYKYTDQQKNNEYIVNLEAKINNITDLIKINEILKNTQVKNENNFYINENINKVIECFQNSENMEIRNISNQNIQIQKNETFNPIEESNNNNGINNLINNNINSINNYNGINNYINNNINNSISNNINDNINNYNFDNNYYDDSNYKNKNINNCLIINSYSSFLSKKSKSCSQSNKNNLKKDLPKINNINKIINRNDKLNNSENSINLQEEGENVNNNENNYNKKIRNEKSNFNNNKNDNDLNLEKLNIISYDIINDSYCPIEIENSITVFESAKKIPFIIYATKDKSIISYNLKNKKIENKIPNAHNEFISNFIYCNNLNIRKELVMSISYKDTNLKIWDFYNWQCFIDIKNVYSHGYLYSACFLNKPNNFYFVTTNWEDSKFADSIRVYDYEKNIIKTINSSEYNAFLIKVLYNYDETYFITCNEENIKSYNYNKNEFLHKYNDNYCYCKFLGFLIFISSKRLFGSCHDKIVRVWDFFNGKMIYKVKIQSNILKGIRLAKERNMLIGYNNNEIQLIDMKDYKAVKILYHNKAQICSIRKIYFNDYRSCLFTQGFDNHIIMWQFME